VIALELCFSERDDGLGEHKKIERERKREREREKEKRKHKTEEQTDSRFVITLELCFSERGDGLGEQLLRVHLREVVDLVLRQELAQVVGLKRKKENIFVF
jgi:hypothetical protein